MCLAFLVQHQEVFDLWCNRVRLDLGANIPDNHWFSWYGYRQRNVCTVGHLQ